MGEEKALNFLEEIIENDLATGKYDRIVTRFPPEPNGYLHIGHAKAICLNFGLTRKYPGYTNLRFDDTNPITEDTEYVDSIKTDIRWLGFSWENERYTSDYFEQLYALAIKLIRKGLAYVDDATPDEIAAMKGTPTQPGTDSPCRNRSVEENLRLFEEMREGKYKDGEKVLRARIDMAHSNMHLRDPLLYRIKHATHHRTANRWCIYPMYDFAHGQSDSIEGVTHSICTLEFVPHRPLYDWLIEHLEIFPSHQYEFARLNLSYTVMSKRKLLQLVQQGVVDGWDDPRMPTISGLRRRGYTPASIRNFCERVGVQKRENLIDLGLLEFFIREDLNRTALRRMAVLDPVKLTITNFPEGQVEEMTIEDNPEDPAAGHRTVPFSRELWIEREDFMAEPPKKFFRLAPGRQVRLKSAYIIQCDGFHQDGEGRVTEIEASLIPESRSGQANSGMKVKGTIHWLSALHAATAEVRLYDRLFQVEDPANAEGDFMQHLNPDSLQVISQAYIEPALKEAPPGACFQFLRKGYFCVDRDTRPEKPVFNRTVTLKDTWSKEKGKAG
jgi:glutaminyl-tRNA synthetase